MKTAVSIPLLAQAIAARNVPAVIGLLFLDPDERFAKNFNALMQKVDADDIEVAYLKPPAILGLRLEAEKIPNEDTLFKILYGIQRRISLNLGVKASRRANPPLDARSCRPGERRFLFGKDDLGLDDTAASGLGPLEQLEQSEALQALTRELQAMPQLPMAVLREVRRFELEHKTRHGAFAAVALLADCDDDGVVIAVRTPDLDVPTRRKPATSVVRQIRALYEDALDYLG